METNALLLQSSWRGADGCRLQVLPDAREPGCFDARVVAGAGAAPACCAATCREIARCSEISRVQVFVETEYAPAGVTGAAPAEALGLLPAAAAAAWSDPRLAAAEYFLIRPGLRPADPVYPVWARDVTRSTQVVEGRYAEIVPLSFEFIPTLNCIYRCGQCAYRQPKEALGIWAHNDFSPRFHMDSTAMDTLLAKLKAAGVMEVLFTGGGEPLLNEATTEGMRRARDLGMKVGLYTNGALVDPAKAAAILQARPAYVRVSLNAGNRRVHDLHHRPLPVLPPVDYFSRTRDALVFLAREKVRLQAETILGVSYLVDPDNASDLVAGAGLVARVARECPGSVDYMRFTPSVDYFGGAQHPRELFEGAVRRIECEAVPLLALAGVESRVYAHRFAGLYQPRTYTQCLAAGLFGGVGPDGTLYWCCEKLFQPSFAFGSLLGEPFDRLWSGEGRAGVRAVVGQAVRGGTASPCPVVCKPHEHNKVFAGIEQFRERGEISRVQTWLAQVHRLVASAETTSRPRLDGFHA